MPWLWLFCIKEKELFRNGFCTNICDCEMSLQSSTVKPRQHKKLRSGEKTTLCPGELLLTQVYQWQLMYAPVGNEKDGEKRTLQTPDAQNFHETTYYVFGIHLIHFIEKNRNGPHNRHRSRSTCWRCTETLTERRLTRRVFWTLRPGWWGTERERSWCRTSSRLLWACASPVASGIWTCRELPEAK